MTIVTRLLNRAVAVAIARVLILVAAIALSVPAELDLVHAAGWHGWVAYCAPFILSGYAAIASALARERRSALIGAGISILIAATMQTIGHLLMAGYLHNGPWLITAVSLLPALVLGHVLHIARPGGRTHALTESGTPLASRPDTAVTVAEKPSKRPVATSPTKVTTGRRPAVPVADIKAAMARMTDAGVKVTGDSLATELGVSGRTARRYLTAMEAVR